MKRLSKLLFLAVALLLSWTMINAQTYTVSPSGWTSKPSQDLTYGSSKIIAATSDGIYIRAKAVANSDGTIICYVKKSNGSFQNSVKVTAFKDLSTSGNTITSQGTSGGKGSGNSGDSEISFEITPDFATGSHTYTLILASGSIKFYTSPITITASSATVNLSLASTPSFGTTTLTKWNTYNYSVKVKNGGSSSWSGNFYLRAGSSFLISWSKTISPGATITLTGDYTPNETGNKTLTLYYQTNGSGAGVMVPQGSYTNPIAITITEESDITAPSATTWEAVDVKSTSAILTGAVNPNGALTQFAFWWGTSSSSLDNHSDIENIEAGTSALSVQYSLTRLSPKTTYYYQIVATNQAGETRAPMKSFTTKEEISFAPQVLMITKGDVVELPINSGTADASQITWISDDADIAKVDSGGIITARNEGACNIVATYDNNILVTYVVLVDNVTGCLDEHEYVDLGLPSGTLWAATNVGAESAEEYGSYFQWGEVEEKENKVYNWTTYKYCNGSVNTLNKYCTNQNIWGGENNPDGFKELEADDDVAQSQWGFDWRIPSIAQFRELFNGEYTMCLPSTFNETKGFLIKSKINNKGIFLPAASYYDEEGLSATTTKGYYWSRTLYEGSYGSDHLAYIKYLEDSTLNNYGSYMRSYGLPVRPVYEGNGSSSNLEVNSTQLDFGSVPIGDSRSLSFEIKNNTYERMNVLPLNLQHSDFTVDWQGGEIEPHSTQQVVVTYSPKSKTFSAGELLNVSNASDSTLINIVASSHTGSNELTTKENLVVWLKDGSKTTFVLNEKPIVTIGDKTLKVNGAKASAEYDFKDILRLTYDGMFPDDITKEISATEAETKKPFTQTSEALVFSSDKEILDVKIVAVSGTVVKRFTVQNGSTFTLPLSQIPTGVYVINVNNISYKVSIR